MKKKAITLDVREDIRQGREPFSTIMRTVATLKQNEDLLLIAPFEPKPLYAVLAQRGFAHQAQATETGDWEVRFTRDPAEPSETATDPEDCPGTQQSGRNPKGLVEVDARGLQPPEPLIKILEAVANLPLETELRARTDRRPMHLYDRLAERGFDSETEQQQDGSFVTYVRRR